MIACTREAVTKEMAGFEREGHITTSGRERRITLLDHHGLRELVEAE